MAKDHVLVGCFGAPHGICGEIKLKSFTGIPHAIATYSPLVDTCGTRQFSVIRLRPFKANVFIATIAGVTDRARAKELTNTTLYVPREALPRTGEEEFYLNDLIGLVVITETDKVFGHVVDVLNFGGGDILEIALATGDETTLLPFKKEVFPHIDLGAGCLTVVPPIDIEIEAAIPDRQD